MMNVKVCACKSNEKKRIFLFFFLFFENFDILPKKETRLDKNDECAKKEGKGKKKENAETRRKELCKKKRKYTSSRSPMDIRFSNCY